MSRETLILERSDLKSLLMATAENFVWNKNSSHSQEKLEKPVGGGGGEWRVDSTPPSEGLINLSQTRLC